MNEPVGRQADDDDRVRGEHLTLDQLSALVDGDLPLDQRGEIEAHIASCGVCRRELAELRATTVMLRALPAYRPRRSFQLDASHARVRQSWWQGFGARLLPALPALRAATVAVAILLVAVTAGELIQDRNGGRSANVAQTQPQVAPAQITSLPVPTMITATEAPDESNQTQAMRAVEPTQQPEPPSSSGAVDNQAPPPAANSAPADATEESGESESSSDGIAQGSGGGASGGEEVGAASAAQAEEGTDSSGADEDASGVETAPDDAADKASAAQAGQSAPASGGDSAGSGEAETGSSASEDDNESIAMASVAEVTATGESDDFGFAQGTLADEPEATASATPVPASPTVRPATPQATPAPATPVPTVLPASPTVVPTQVPFVEPQAPSAKSTSDDGVSGWRIAQIGLAVLLIWLVVSVVGLQRLRGRRTGHRSS